MASVAYMGQEGSFEAADMAKWFPELLAQMASTGITGQDAVTQLGAMLQVQIKSAGSADAAANNLKNWMSKIGSGETVKGYADVGIDYKGSMDAAIAKGKSTFEASFDLAKAYVQKTDPNKAAKLDEGLAKISQEVDPAKAQAMSEALAETLRTGDLFADMQVKTALMAYTQNKKVYEELKKNASDPAGKSNGILDKNLAERRETSTQRWAEAGQTVNDSMRAIGDALRPVTDQLATGISAAANGLASLAQESPKLVTGLAAVTAGAFVLAKAWAAIKIGRGLANIARGSVGNNSNIVQRVFVTNPDDVGGGLDEGKGKGKSKDAGGKGKSPGTKLSIGDTVSKGATVAKRIGPLALVGAGLQVTDTYQNAKTQNEKAEGYGGAVGGLVGGVAGGALAGAAIGSIIPVVGTAIGGVIGGLLGAWGGGELGATVGKRVFGGPDKPDGAPSPAIGDTVKTSTAEQRKLSEQEAAAIMAKVPAIAPLARGNDIGNVVRSMAVTPALPVSAASLMPAVAAVKAPESPKVDQEFTFAPTSTFTIQGDVKDPAQLVNELAPHLRRMFDEFAREAQSKQLFDAPHVG